MMHDNNNQQSNARFNATQLAIQHGGDTTLAAIKIEGDKNAAERKEAAEYRAAASAARQESIRRDEAELEAKEKAQIAEMKAKQATARIAARKAEEAEESERQLEWERCVLSCYHTIMTGLIAYFPSTLLFILCMIHSIFQSPRCRSEAAGGGRRRGGGRAGAVGARAFATQRATWYRPRSRDPPW